MQDSTEPGSPANHVGATLDLAVASGPYTFMSFTGFPLFEGIVIDLPSSLRVPCSGLLFAAALGIFEISIPITFVVFMVTVWPLTSYVPSIIGPVKVLSALNSMVMDEANDLAIASFFASPVAIQAASNCHFPTTWAPGFAHPAQRRAVAKRSATGIRIAHYRLKFGPLSMKWI